MIRFLVIISFRDFETEEVFQVVSLNSLRVPPGNRLEALKGNRSGQHSIRINDQWRVCFVWIRADAEEVEIVDYH